MTGLGMPPEWPEVQQRAAKVDKVNPGEIEACATKFEEAARNADDHTAGLTNAAAPLQEGVWSGPGADSFFAYVDKVAKAGARVKDKLDEAAAELRALQEKLANLKQQVQSTRDDAKTDIEARNRDAQMRMEAEPGNTGIVDEAMRQNSQTAVAARDRIDELLKQANTEIAKAKKLMKQEVDQGFSSVPPPGSAESHSPGGASGGDSGGGGGSSGGGGTSSGGGGGLGPSGGPPSSGPPPGNVEQWIREAIKILQANGVPVTEENIDEIWTIIEKESGGDPHAINNWDSNAAKGTPSKGLMQCIDPTFQAHALPGHGDIYDPVDNIIAGVRYTFDRYGGFEGHPGLASMASGGGYQGY